MFFSRSVVCIAKPTRAVDLSALVHKCKAPRIDADQPSVTLPQPKRSKEPRSPSEIPGFLGSLSPAPVGMGRDGQLLRKNGGFTLGEAPEGCVGVSDGSAHNCLLKAAHGAKSLRDL